MPTPPADAKVLSIRTEVKVTHPLPLVPPQPSVAATIVPKDRGRLPNASSGALCGLGFRHLFFEIASNWLRKTSFWHGLTNARGGPSPSSKRGPVANSATRSESGAEPMTRWTGVPGREFGKQSATHLASFKRPVVVAMSDVELIDEYSRSPRHDARRDLVTRELKRRGLLMDDPRAAAHGRGRSYFVFSPRGPRRE
jgi:hypothetical protein